MSKKQSGASRELFLMSPPGPSWQLRGRANFRSDAADAVDAAAAFEEWLSLATAIEDAGGQILVLPPVDGLTGMPYCAEAGHPLAPAHKGASPRFLLPRMWAPHRQHERDEWRPLLSKAGFELLESERGFWEGQGDVASFKGTTLLFYGGRTDREGFDAVRKYFSDDALVLETRQPAFHGNVAVLPIDSIARIVVCPALLVGDSIERLRERVGREVLLEISEEEARAYCTNALPIGKRLLAPSVASARVLDALREAGMDIVSLSMRELCEKAGGASRCLVCRVPSAIVDALPNLVPTDLDELAKAGRAQRA